GIVVDESGKPVGGAMVMLMGDPRNGAFIGPVGGVQSAADGRFAIARVTPGSYRLNASVPMRMDGRGGVSWSCGSSGIGSVATFSGGAIGGGTSGTFTTFSADGGPAQQPAEVVVADADVSGVRLVVRAFK